MSRRKEILKRIAGHEGSMRRTEAEYMSQTLEVLLREVAELAQKYVGEHERLQRSLPGSDEFETSWTEVATVLPWLQDKISDILEEMERIEDTWPEESS